MMTEGMKSKGRLSCNRWPTVAGTKGIITRKKFTSSTVGMTGMALLSSLQESIAKVTGPMQPHALIS